MKPLGFSKATFQVLSGAKVGSAYLNIKNPNKFEDVLLSVESNLASRVELHDHLEEGGVLKMVPLRHINIPAKGRISLTQGGKHLMLYDMNAEIFERNTLVMTLNFEKTGPVKVTFKRASGNTKCCKKG